MRKSLLGAVLIALLSSDPAAAQEMSPVDSGWVDVDGGRLYYEVTGSGPALVLIHGGFGDRRMWDGQFHSFARSYRVIRYDHRGFGRSSAPEGPYSAVDDLRRLLDHLGVEQAHLVGNSMGASVALDFALLEPDRVLKVVAAANGANGYPYTREEVEGVVRVFEAARTDGVERAVELWLDHPMIAVASRDPALAPLLRLMVEDNASIFKMAHWPGERLDPSAYERLGEIRTPVLFLVGELDTPLVRRAARESADRIAGSEWVLLPGADHLPQMESAAFDEYVLAFLQR